MKKGVITTITIGILALGGIGGGLFLQNRTEQLIQNEIARISAPFPGLERASCDDVRVSFLQRTVAISNLRLSGPKGELRCRELVLRPAFSAMLAAGVPSLCSLLLPDSGPVVMGDMEARDMATHAVLPILPQMPDSPTHTLEAELATLTLVAVQLDGRHFAALLNGDTPPLRDVAGQSGAALMDAARIRLRRVEPIPSTLTMERLRLRDVVTGPGAALLEIERLSDVDADTEKSWARLRLTEISIPPTVLDAIALNGLFSFDELTQALAESGENLCRTLTMEGGKFAFPPSPAESTCVVKRIFIESRDTPQYFQIQLDRLRIAPYLALPKDGPLSIPGIAMLQLDFSWKHEQRGRLFREDVSLSAADMGRLTIELEHDFDFYNLSSDADLLSLPGARLGKGFLRYEDEGGIGRMLAARIRDRKELLQVDALAAQLSALFPGRSNQGLVDALRTTLLTPGTLELRLRDDMRTTVFDLLASGEPGRRIDASAVPGKENVKEQILRFQIQ